MLSARPTPDLDRFFRGLAEHAFHGRLGVVDPPLVDYVSTLLLRFFRNDHLRSLPGGDALAGDHLVMMLAALPAPAAERGVSDDVAGPADRDDAVAALRHGVAYRHIGDYTLFWTGLYPEALRRRAAGLDDYRVAGKRAYWIASTCEPDAAAEKSLLERLSRDYDACAEGLAEVRRAWSEA
jgi:hypothetical protein